MRHTVLLACGLGAALAFPALAEAGHRHTPSCGHPRPYGYAYEAPRGVRGYAPFVAPRAYRPPRSYRRYSGPPRRVVVPLPVYGAPAYAPAYAPRYVPYYYAPRPSVSLQLYGGPGGLHGNVGLFFGW